MDIEKAGEAQFATSKSIELTPFQRVLKGMLLACPKPIKAFFLSGLVYLLESRYGRFIGMPYHGFTVFRLPCNVALKQFGNYRPAGPNETHALCLANSIKGVCSPRIIDFIPSWNRCYLLTAWIEGDKTCDVWDELTTEDKDHLVKDLRSQITAMQQQTQKDDHIISNALGGPVIDPRLPWVTYDNPQTFAHHRDFVTKIWTGLQHEKYKNTLRPLFMPFIERDEVPIAFCHCDIGPHNLIFPGGLERWRAGQSSVCMIDWEYGAWMPVYWEALKTVFLVVDKNDEWFDMAKRIFPEHAVMIDADWEWQYQTGTTLV